MDSSAVEYISSTVPGWIVRDAFLVSEAHHLYGQLAFLQFVLELLHFGQFAEYGAEVGIFWIVLLQQLAQVLDGVRHTLYEVRFLLKVPPESICAQYLQGTEQHEVSQLAEEIIAVYRLVFAQCLDIFIQ